LSYINKHTLKEMQHFFETYKSIEGKKVVIKGFHGKKDALIAVKKGLKMYRDKFSESK